MNPAAQRLARDLEEVRRNPLPNISAAPVEDDLFCWHVNLRGDESNKLLAGTIVHLIITFPETYPVVPPAIRMTTPLPHPNVIVHGSLISLCLDMLEVGTGTNESYTGWSSAMSVHSLLVQLQAFLLDDSMQYSLNGTTIDRARTAAAAFKCSECGHSNETPSPRFATEEDIKGSRSELISITGPEMAAEARRALENMWTPPSRRSIPSAIPPQSQPQPAKVPTSPLPPTPPVGHVGHPSIGVKCNSEGWVEVGKRRHSGKKQQIVDNTASGRGTTTPPPSNPKSVNYWSSLEYFVCATCHNRRASTYFTRSQREKLWHPQCMLCQKERQLQGKGQLQANISGSASSLGDTVVGVAAVGGDSDLSSAARKNRLRAQRRRENKLKRVLEQQQELEKGGGGGSGGKKGNERLEADSGDPSDTSDTASGSASESGLDVEAEEEGPQQPQQQCVEQHVRPAPHLSMRPTSSGSTSSSGCSQYTHIGCLPYAMSLCVMQLLAPSDLAKLARTCRHFAGLVRDSVLWRRLFRIAFPYSEYTAASMCEWRRVYQIQMDHLLSDLRCFHTKATHEEEVLGIPLQYTVNPRKGSVDYIYSTFDLLSASAFNSGVRRTVWGESFTAWLPLYLSHDHFLRGLPALRKTVVKLSPQWRSTSFHPVMALELLGRLMNTMIVLLCDKGIHASDRALEGYCQLHRLLIAIMAHHPGLAKELHTRLHDFSRKEKARTKSSTPSLGDLLPLLTVSSSVGWPQIAHAVVSEGFDRGVLWSCKAHPELAKVPPRGGGAGQSVDEDRLSKTWSSKLVSLRLIMFHVYFLRRFAPMPPVAGAAGELGKGRSLVKIAEQYDQFYGQPARHQRSDFHRNVAEIFEVSDWPGFFKRVCLPCPSKSDLTRWLEDSVGRSAKKGYHTPGMDFSRIQSSGVSKLLLKGQSFEASPTLRRAQLRVVWRYPPGETNYLDASILMYSGHTPRDYVDWCSTHAQGVQHSGDMMSSHRNQGEHVVDLDLRSIDPSITELYVTLSSYSHGTTLQDIIQPEVAFTDVDVGGAAEGGELCRYQLEDCSSKLGKFTAVVMCKLYRTTETVAGQRGKCASWGVRAIGELSMGRASGDRGYKPMYDVIDSIK